MGTRVALNHRTAYRYDRRVTMSPHVIRLRPAVHSRTPIHSYSLTIRPEPHFLNWQQDAFGNFLARVAFPEKTDHFSFEVDLVADLEVYNPFDFFVDDDAEHYPFEYQEAQREELLPYLKVREKGPLLEAFLKTIDRSERKIVDFLVTTNRFVEQHIDYSVRMEPGVQTCEETLERRVGSCRDSAYLLVQVFRHLGLAARFVSGYLVQLTADQKALDGPSGTEEDFTDLHAWVEVYVPGAGWIGLDPTSGLLAGEGHIPLACTPEPASAAPVVGGLEACEVEEFEFSNTVRRIREEPRVTKPYTEREWEAIDALGQLVDDKLKQEDVRLSMGGEPTFISIDDMDGEEWNTTADSAQKRKLARALLARLQSRYAPAGLRYYGEGKWYPGEPLPRWSYDLLWRKDGQPLWHDQKWLGEPTGQGTLEVSDGEKFARMLARALEVDPDCLRTAYEDRYYYLWYESQLPTDLDTSKANLKDPLTRQYLANLLSRGMEAPVGHVLPLRWNYATDRWTTVRWEFRRDHLYLTPGGSALGLRLPLSSLRSESDEPPEEVVLPRSPLEPANPFPVLPIPRLPEKPAAERLRVAPSQVTTALSVEVRDGELYVFLPPVDDALHYLKLLNAIEATAAHLKLPVIIEGYPCPYDIRLEQIKVTPDPGVIEVNIHPTQSWSDLKSVIDGLYEDARQSRLGTEKFMIDGRHTGTGGGNHVTLGGITPADSPFLRRPGLLRSFITFWQHHPGLSYLFSGTFIGPTSQAPRVDEGRSDRLYELEIAFQQLPESSDLPWIVDRVLRNLLTDLTGNTHRAEFCIDKLYSPDSSTGRLGIVELRAFEMPPHPQMSLVQMLLMRTFVALFWKSPYQGRLVRWDTELHDRFLLPHYVREDLKDVVETLQDHGYPFQIDWLDAFFEFRFPVFGRVQYGAVGLELRMALEPWNVLGEESTSSGTARYVDSSVERLQVTVDGLTEGRHILTCNGRRLPLRSTGRTGEFVAGVRYKAWDPWSALHPTIKVQAPLTFDIIDTWNKKSLGGCVYHVSHPGGLSYDTLPINANEAEARRASRFRQQGHTPGEIDPHGPSRPLVPAEGNILRTMESRSPGQKIPAVIPREEPSLDFPLTLDLREHS
jgi:uncharacterized protein (DUF2126 family)/transglutaminase-like putative cysteine protease